jgi:hypothetical protein
MRNLLIAALLLLCAAGLFACSDPARTARREVDRITRITQRTEVNLKRATKAAMVDVAVSEGTTLGQELKTANCPALSATQPTTIPAHCEAIIAEGKARYAKKLGEVTTVARRVDKSIGGVYASLLVVVDLLEDIEAGLRPGGWEAKLAGIVADAVKLAADLFEAYNQFRLAFGKSAGGAP